MKPNDQQHDLFEMDEERNLLDQLLTDSKLYRQSKDYKELLDFVVRLRNFAPFNAMLLQIQKPGVMRLQPVTGGRDFNASQNRMPVRF